MKRCLFVIVLICLGSCASAQQKVSSYEECIAGEHTILRSLPPICVSADGQQYRKPQPKKLCVDRCGDGECQEMVCMAEGCPCAESAQSCAEDCGEPAD